MFEVLRSVPNARIAMTTLRREWLPRPRACRVDDHHRTDRQWTHRRHRCPAGGGRRPRRRAQQQSWTRDPHRPRGSARTPCTSGHRGRGRRGRRHRRGDDPAQGLPRGAGRAAARQGRHRHQQLLLPGDGHIAELDDESTTSSELLQAHLPESRVVKAFSNLNSGHLGSLQRPAGHPERSVLAIAGDDVAAKQTVTEFLDSIGYDAYDVGPLSEGWRYQPDTPAYGQPYVAPGSEFPGPGHQVTAELLKDKLDAAERHRHT